MPASPVSNGVLAQWLSQVMGGGGAPMDPTRAPAQTDGMRYANNAPGGSPMYAPMPIVQRDAGPVQQPGGQPVTGASGQFYDFMQRANAALYPPFPPAQDPNAWTNQLWQYSQGGGTPFQGVPQEAWPDQMDALGAALPWAQLGQNGQQLQFNNGLQNRQFDAQQMQQAFERMMALRGAGSGEQNQAFQQWLATQQLGMQQGQQGVDNTWRNRQMDLQAQQQAFTQMFQQQGFTADQAAQAWNQNFQQGQAGTQQGNWLAQFQNQVGQQGVDNSYRQNEADRGWQQWMQQYGLNQNAQQFGQDYQNRQLGEGQRQFDTGTQLTREQMAQAAQQFAQQYDLSNRQFGENIRMNDINTNMQQVAQMFNQDYQNRQLGEGQRQYNIGQENWQNQFGAQRADTAWNQDYQNRQMGEGQRQFDVGQGNWQNQFNAQRADTAWTQAFNTTQSEWQKQMDQERNNIQKEGQYLSAFGRRIAPGTMAAM